MRSFVSSAARLLLAGAATIVAAALLVLLAAAVVFGQGRSADDVLAEARAALGGNRLASLETLAAQGRTLRTGPGGNTTEAEFELAFERPDKYRLRSALMPMGNMSIYRHTGFNGGQVIEEMDRPPNLAGGAHIVIRIAGPDGPMDPNKMTPEQKAEHARVRLLANKKEFARLALGLFAASPDAYPLQFRYAGEAEAPDGKADIIDVTGEGGFAARLFVDQASHRPLMLSWMDKERLIIRGGPETRTFRSAGGGGPISHGAPPPEGPRMSKEEMAKAEKEFEAKHREAEANRKDVEHRLYYGDYRPVNGLTLPHRIQLSIDGKPSEEMLFDSFKVNGRLDARTFDPSK